MKEARVTYYAITGYKAKTVSQIYGGLNSRNFLIDNKYVLRIKTPSIDGAYNPKTEYMAEKMVAPLDITPKLCHFDTTTGLKMTSWIPDTRFLDMGDLKNDVILVAATLKKIHQLPSDDLPLFASLKRLDEYGKAAGVASFSAIELKIAKHIEKLEQKGPLVFAHNDLVRGNLLFKDKRLYVIDYEYAGRNHPLFDLASFITENNIDDPDTIDIFLASYYGEEPIPKADFIIYCRFLDYLWYYWAQGMYKKTGQSIYKTIALVKHQRISRH